MTQVALGLCMHRPETLPPLAAAMENHDAILVEDLPGAEFDAMLDGRMSIDDYLLEVDAEYPRFSRGFCELLRERKAAGVAVRAAEPFMEELTAIHFFLAEGGKPAEIRPETARGRVYAAEKAATGALIHYYDKAMSGRFREAVAAVQQFARADAERFRLREEMRAAAIAEAAADYDSVFVEAGDIHYGLYPELRRRLAPGNRLVFSFVTGEIARNLWGRSHLYGPGDQLALLYRFHPESRDRRADAWGARAIIYAKVLEKEETDGENFPHARSMVRTTRTVERLSIAECNLLFPAIRRAGTRRSREIVTEFLAERDGPEMARDLF
ncbi:MAG: hypothetical protein ACLFRG_20175 [Desulfococcaceae bacterium]